MRHAKFIHDEPADLTGGHWALARSLQHDRGGVIVDQARDPDAPPPASAQITGTAAGETLNGTSSGDFMQGLGGADTINGGAGNDTIYSGSYSSFDTGPEVDTLNGQDGNDYLTGGVGDIFDGGTGFDVGRLQLQQSTVGAQIDITQCAAGVVQSTGAGTIVNVEGLLFFGGSGADVVSGGTAQETLRGGGGNDTLSGLAASDQLFGQGGDDTLNGGDGYDELFGDESGDIDVGGNDTLDGGANNDLLHGGGGDDIIIGGAGNDDVWGDGGSDLLQGGDGGDRMRGGTDLVVDTLKGEAGDDELIGTLGDVFDGGVGYDLITINISETSAAQTFNMAASATGTTQTIVGGGTFVNMEIGRVYFGSGADVFIGDTVNHSGNGPGIYSADVVFGGGGNDNLSGGIGTDNLNGEAGNDILIGGFGDDQLHGGDGDDVLRAGQGQTYNGHIYGDYVYGDAGVDTVDFSDAASGVTVDLTLSTRQETGGAGGVKIVEVENISGSNFADTLTGAGGANALSGGGGNDTLIGGGGNDALDGGAGNDLFKFAAGDGVDTITGFVAGGTDDSIQVTGFASYTLSQEGADLRVVFDASNSILLKNVTAASFTAADINIPMGSSTINGTPAGETLTGTSGADIINGLGGNDTLKGVGGNDQLNGGDDDDILEGGDGDDTLLGGAGADILNGGADRDTASYEESTVGLTINLTTGVHTGDALGDTFNSVEILWLSKFADTFTGSAGDDEVRGYDGNDTLNGANGIDTLRGEVGNDTLNGDDGDDLLNGGLGADTLNGGNGTDTAVYLLATAGVTINLTTGVHTGEAAGDTFNSVEHFQLTNGFTLIDTFTGSAGNDWVAGYKGVDNLNGMDGNDTLNGGEHNDVLNGGNGADKLYGGTGNDSETGGAGADQFTINAKAFGADTVTDFENGVDKIRVQNVAGWDDFSDVVVSSNGSGWAVITFNDGSTITLTGTVASDVDASDFLWI